MGGHAPAGGPALGPRSLSTPPVALGVLPDVAGVNKVFDYLPPDGPPLAVGTMVRVPLHGRRVPGWVVDTDSRPPEGVRLLTVAAVRGVGPSPELVDLARWAAWRWAGRPAALLGASSPPRLVRALPPAGPGRPGEGASGPDWDLAGEAVAAGRCVLELPPAASAWPVVARVASLLEPGRSVLVLAPSTERAAVAASRLRRAGYPVAHLPDGWAAAAAGGRVVVGARAAAWAPAPGLAGVVVLDAHDEVYKEERAPSWQAWEVAAERGARAGVPVVLVSPCPTLEMAAWAPVLRPPRAEARRGWAAVEVVDRTGDDPRSGLFGRQVVDAARTATAALPAVFVLNRKGRAGLLACRACGALAVCEECGAAMARPRSGDALVCSACGHTRPVLCAECGAQRLSVLRPGVTRVGEELSLLAGRPATEVSADVAGPPEGVPLLVGTEAVLHRVRRAASVAFLDFDMELTAPRLRAGEEALALLARASRLVGGRRGRVVVQTRLPRHPVLAAAVAAEPRRLLDSEGARRAELRLPPFAAMAVLSGEAAPALAEALKALGIEAVGPQPGGAWLARAADHTALCDALAAAGRPPGRLRVEVDPLRA